MGQLVRANGDPDPFDALLRAAVEEPRPLHEVEHEAHGFTHADIGAYLLTLWGLPAEVVDAVSRHHHPLPPHAAVDPGVTESVRAAHVLVQAARPSAIDPTDAVPPQPAAAELVASLAASVFDRWSAQATSDEEETMGIAGAAL